MQFSDCKGTENPRTNRHPHAFIMKNHNEKAQFYPIMKSYNNSKIWLVIGVIILVVLLLLWLSEAFSVGDTDVNAPEAIAYFNNIV